MIQIRQNVFETNSSSSHSMCTCNKEGDCIDTEKVVDLLNGNGTWKIDPVKNTYERYPCRLLETFSEKVLYVLGLVECTRPEKNLLEELTKIVAKYISQFTGFEAIDGSFGYTQNYGFDKWLEKNNISLEDFLTKSKYFAVADGDEYCIFNDIEECGLLSKDVKTTISYS